MKIGGYRKRHHSYHKMREQGTRAEVYFLATQEAKQREMAGERGTAW